MFSKQAARLEELRGILPEQALDVLREIFGNPTQPLEHHGPVSFEGPTPDGAEDSAGIYLGTRYEALMRGKLLGSVEYGLAQEAYRTVYNTRASVDEYWIKCRKCSKHTGEDVDGPSFDVLLLPTGGNLPDVDSGDVIAYLFDEHKVRLGLFCCTCAAAVESSEGSPSGSPSSASVPASASACAAECLALTVDGINKNTAWPDGDCDDCHTFNGTTLLNFYHNVVEAAWTSHFWYSCDIPTDCSSTGIVRFYVALMPHITGDGAWAGDYWVDVYLCDGTDDPDGDAGWPWSTYGKNIWIHWTGKKGPEYTLANVTWDDLCNGNIGLFAAGMSGGCDIPLAVNTGSLGVGDCPVCDGSSSAASESEASESEASEASEAECNYTGSIDVVVCDPYRVGDYIHFPQKRMTYENGLLCTIEDLPETEVYVCCPGSVSDASSEDGGS